MKIGEIDILEKGLEDQAEEIARIEAEDTEPSVPGVTSGQPQSAAEERARAIKQYEAEQQQRFQKMTSVERLASMGVTVTRDREA